MEVFLGTIMMWAPNFAPRGWAFCNGQILPIAQYTALFSLLGTSYGGNGTTTFALPNMAGRVPVAAGSGPGLQPYNLGQSGGVEQVTLNMAQLPAHTHPATLSPFVLNVSAENAADSVPVEGTRIAVPGSSDGRAFTPSLGFNKESKATVALSSDSITQGTLTVGVAGGSQPVDVHQPYLAVNFIIALEGIFPSRN